MRLPVVATDIRGCREAVVNEVTGLLVPAKDAQSLARAIRRVLVNPEISHRFGDAGRARVTSTFDERFVFARLENCYRDLGVSFA